MDEEEKDETSDIQNYLASFHKEIENVGGDSESEEETFCEIVDEELDQNSADERINVESTEKKEIPSRRQKEIKIIKLEVDTTKSVASSSKAFETITAEDGDQILLENIKQEPTDEDESQTLEMMAKIAEQANAKMPRITGSTGLNDLDNSYQTVTIVPSDTNPGELSYVLFVSDVDDLDKNAENIDMSVYDFNNGGKYAETFLSEEIDADGVKMCAIRIGSRRTQFLTQQHVCSFCSYTSPKRYLLSRHMKSHSDERPHKCAVCERGFKTVASLQNHVNTHTGTRPHMCKDCDSCFTTSGELVRHVRYKHTHEKPHKCTECDYASVELSKLKRHIRCHTGERPYQCTYCTYASPDTYKLKRHLRIHTGEKPYECDICQSRFTQSNSLKAHKLIHSGKKPVFHCEYCPATCGRKTDLRIHMEKLHSYDTPHRCKRCAKVFLDRYSYKLHIKSHDGEKCYKCDLCNYASISQRHLDTHMLIHTDQKPFQCLECGQSFRQKQLLKRHRNLYHNPNYIPPVPQEKTHICSQCSKAFRHKGNLIRHYAVHDPDATMLERQTAMRIGEPKEPGEVEDGEEDYDSEENDSNDSKLDDQVVVFEVIQLPSSNGEFATEETITMVDGHTVMLNGEEPQSYSVIESVEDSVDGFMNNPESISDTDNNENLQSFEIKQSSSSTNWRKKTNQNFRKKSLNHVQSSKKEQVKSNYTRLGNPARRGRPPKSFSGPSRLCKIVAKKPLSNDESSEISTFHEDSILHEDKVLTLAREQNIVKSLEDCFGFNVEPENNENNLVMSNSFHTDMVEDIC